MKAVNRFSQSVVCLVVLIMLATSVGVVYDRGLSAQKKVLAPGCGTGTGNPCMEIQRCWLIFICRTDTYFYPEESPN